MNDKITILVVDDHPLFRQGVVDAISYELDMKVIGQASSGEEGLAIVHSQSPAICLMDINMPGMNGQQITYQINQEKLSTRVILMTGYDDVDQAIHAILAGAYGYTSKDIQPQALAKIIRDVVAGKYLIGEKTFNRYEIEQWLEEQMEGARRNYSEPGNPYHPLSEREMEVLNCVVRGMSNKEIASLLGISHQTVKNHVTAVLRKFGVEDRTQAVVYALKRGWVTLKDSFNKPQE